MFWGVTLETGKRYSQRVEESYHLTNAALEPPTDQKKPSKYVSVMVEHDKSDYMVCTLEPNRNLQVHLDLMFVEGEEVTYYLTGEGTVHLTGYLVGEGFDDYGEEDDEEDEESSEEEVEVNGLPPKAKNNKRKNEALESSPELTEKKAKVDSKVANKESKVNENDSKTSTKKIKKEVDLEPKKNKNENQVSKNINNIESDEDDSEDEEESDESDANDSLGLIDNEAVEADSDDDEDEEESDDSDAESEEQKISPIKGKVNQNQKQPQSNQKQQNQKNPNKNQFNSQKSPENQQKQFGSGQKGGFGGQRGGFGGQQRGGFGGQQRGGFGGAQRGGFQGQGGQQKWNQSSGQKNQRGGNQWQNRGSHNNSPNFGNKGENQNNSPNFGGKGGKQTPNFKGQQKGNFNQTPNFSGQKEKTKQRKLNGGIIVEDLVEGNGPNANVGKFVHVNYVGRLPDNKVFDKTHNKPFSFRLGRGEVIKGWDIGLQDMKVGGKRKIIIPPNMGYGTRSVGPIPANSTLQFEVELKSVS